MKVSKLFILLVMISFLSCNKDKSSWESAQSNNTVASYKDYISKFPNGDYKNKADSCIQILIWNDTQKTNTVESYENYLNLYPSGYYKLIADSLLEETLWNGASTNSDMEYCLKYKDKFINGKYISKVKDYIDKYLIEPDHAGLFKIGLQISSLEFKGFNIVSEQNNYFNIFSEDNNMVTEYFVTLKGEKLLELYLNENNNVLKIKILSDKFKTKKNISIKSTVNYFKTKYTGYLVSGDIIDTYTGEREYYYLFAKGENGIEFEINGNDVNNNDNGLALKNVSDKSKIIGIQICHKDIDEYASTLKYVEEQKAQKVNEKQEQDRQAQALRESQTSRSSQSNSNSSSNSNNSYKRSYRDNFESRSAVFEFLANHTFVSSNGSRVRYDMSTLTISFSDGKQLEFTNVELLGFNQNTARIRAMWVGNGSTVSFILDAASGTVTDNEGTLYRAGN